MKCSYSHCKHENKEIVGDDFITVNTKTYYHPDCYAEKETMAEIVDVWVKKIDAHPIFTELRKHINVIVYEWGIPADKLLFYLNWAINNNWGLRHPAGLRYLAKSDDAERAWKRAQASGQRANAEILEDCGNKFDYIPAKTRGIADILR